MQVRLYLSDPSYLSLWLLFSYLKYPSSHVRNFPKLRVRIYHLSAELYLEHSESVSIPGNVSLTSISIRGTVSWTSFLFHRLVVRLSSEQNVENIHPVWSFGLCLCGKKKVIGANIHNIASIFFTALNAINGGFLFNDDILWCFSVHVSLQRKKAI